jgi:hypothetical protein
MKQIERRIEDLERQTSFEPPEDLTLYLYWSDAGEGSLTEDQRESNRRCREWAAMHPGCFSDVELEWADDL